MRSPIGPVLVIIGLATMAVLILVLLQSMSVRDDLRRARDEVGALQARVDTLETVTASELRDELEGLESSLRESLIGGGGFGTDPGQPAGGSGSSEDILDRIDDVLARITALDRRVDDICEGVPVC
jgi:hypothetical protein